MICRNGSIIHLPVVRERCDQNRHASGGSGHIELRDGSVERYKVGAIATNEKQTSSGVIDAFVQSIMTNTPPSISGEEGMRSLNVILAAFEAQVSGKVVSL
ncbi:putative dehydrogenase [Paenibacillus sp. PvR052]|nr:putative dehydrogenase [Paenibacillus sp. PvP091]MBP1172015.1 putative dehydrogenase [Paenibacillus sp. PvR098]MBP2438396.1 putative dehydrogenase [Paenibacillus sp. PvP052]